LVVNRAPEGSQWVKEVWEYRSAVVRLAANIVGPADAEDVWQMTVMETLDKRPNYPTKIKPWLLRIARNIAVDFVRRALRERKAWNTVAGQQPADDDPIARAQSRRNVVEAGQRLTRNQRICLLLDCLDEFADLTEHDKARILGIRPSYVRTVRRRALAKLRPHQEPRAEHHVSVRSTRDE